MIEFSNDRKQKLRLKVEYQTQEQIIDMVSRDGVLIEFIPSEKRTPDVCLSAAETNQYDADPLSKEYWSFAAQNSGVDSLANLSEIAKASITDDVATEALPDQTYERARA